MIVLFTDLVIPYVAPDVYDGNFTPIKHFNSTLIPPSMRSEVFPNYSDIKHKQLTGDYFPFLFKIQNGHKDIAETICTEYNKLIENHKFQLIYNEHNNLIMNQKYNNLVVNDINYNKKENKNFKTRHFDRCATDKNTAIIYSKMDLPKLKYWDKF